MILPLVIIIGILLVTTSLLIRLLLTQKRDYLKTLVREMGLYLNGEQNLNMGNIAPSLRLFCDKKEIVSVPVYSDRLPLQIKILRYRPTDYPAPKGPPFEYLVVTAELGEKFSSGHTLIDRESRGLFRKPEKASGYAEIRFEHHPEFSKKYYVSTNNRHATYTLLNEGIIRHISSWTDDIHPVIEIKDGHLTAYMQAHHCSDKDEMRDFFDYSADLARLLRSK